MSKNRVILEVDNYLLAKIERLAAKNCMQNGDFCEHVINIFCIAKPNFLQVPIFASIFANKKSTYRC